MKSIFAVAVIASLIGSSALAQSIFDDQTMRVAQVRNLTGSHDVYMGNKKLGQDPDPNVRFELRRDNYGQK
jgi:hypothetical protein